MQTPKDRDSAVAWVEARELKRLRLLKALDVADGSWKDEDHPELKGGATRWVAKLRRQDEAQSQRRAQVRARPIASATARRSMNWGNR